MMKYSKNLILCGDINYHCLLCTESFQSTEEVEKHIRWEQHRKLIKNQAYLPKFAKDSVFKIGENYFCEVCNFLASKLAAIKLHIKDVNHSKNKSNPETEKENIVKCDSGFVVVSKTIVTNNEWHGVLKNHCLFCNIAVNDFESHITLPKHIINLIQSKVIHENEGQYYRLIDQENFYCFKCKKTFLVETLSDHWVSNEHCAKDDAKTNTSAESKLFDIDKENNIATCKECKKILKLDYKAMIDHKIMVHNTAELNNSCKELETYKWSVIVDHGKRRAELKAYGKDNFMKLNEGGSKGYCSLCHTYMSAHMNIFMQHVKGARHTGHLELKGLIKKNKKPEKPRYKTKPFRLYFKNTVNWRDTSIVMLNNEICIELLSFSLLAPVYHIDKLKCFICDDEYPQDVKKHFDTGHREKFLNSELVTTLKGEVVREIRSGIFHCGFCNQIYPGWSLLEKHLRSWKHMESKLHSRKMYDNALSSSLTATHDRYNEFIQSINILD